MTLMTIRNTLRVESFAGRNFRGYKLLRTPQAKIKFRGYKLSRTLGFLVGFSYFDTIFRDFSSDISRTPMKVRFCRYKLSRMAKKFAKSRNFLPAKLSTFKVIAHFGLSARKPICAKIHTNEVCRFLSIK